MSLQKNGSRSLLTAGQLLPDSLHMQIDFDDAGDANTHGTFCFRPIACVHLLCLFHPNLKFRRKRVKFIFGMCIVSKVICVELIGVVLFGRYATCMLITTEYNGVRYHTTHYELTYIEKFLLFDEHETKAKQKLKKSCEQYK